MADFASGWLTVVNLVLIVAGILAGAFAWRRFYSRGLTEIQQRVIEALKQENEELTRRVSRLEDVMDAVRYALRKRGIVMSVNGKSVTLTDTDKPRSTTVTLKKREIAAQARRDDHEADAESGGA